MNALWFGNAKKEGLELTRHMAHRNGDFLNGERWRTAHTRQTHLEGAESLERATGKGPGGGEQLDVGQSTKQIVRQDSTE